MTRWVCSASRIWPDGGHALTRRGVLKQPSSAPFSHHGEKTVKTAMEGTIHMYPRFQAGAFWPAFCHRRHGREPETFLALCLTIPIGRESAWQQSSRGRGGRSGRRSSLPRGWGERYLRLSPVERTDDASSEQDRTAAHQSRCYPMQRNPPHANPLSRSRSGHRSRSHLCRRCPPL